MEEQILSWLRDRNLIDVVHRFIGRKDAYRRLAVALGWSWEDEFGEMACNKGFCVQKPPSATLPFDCYVNSYRVQCKFECSVCDPDKHAVDIRRRHERRYAIDDFDIMAIKIVSAEDFKSATYFIPSIEMKDRRKKLKLKGRIRLSDYADRAEDWAQFVIPL
jgi:hypothetical protein